jgi:large subunit ribosomal protein L18
MSIKKTARLRRAKRARAKISELRVNRLCVYRSPRHIYAQVISPNGNQVLASASTVEKESRGGKTGNVDAAAIVGKLIAEPVLKRLHLTVRVMPTMAELRPWLRRRAKADWNFKDH